MFLSEYPLGMNGQYLVPTENCTVEIDGPTMAMNGTEPQNKFFYMTKPYGEWKHFEGYVTPVNKFAPSILLSTAEARRLLPLNLIT